MPDLRTLRTRTAMAWAVLRAQAGQQSKLAVHINSITEGERMIAYVAAAKPRAVILLQHDPVFIAQLRAVSPNTKIIGRYHVDNDDQSRWLARSPESAARQLFEDHISHREPRKYDFWVGLNETARNSDESWRVIGRFDGEATRQAHAMGLKYLAGSFGVGHPSGTLEEIRRRVNLPEVRAGWADADGIACHEYLAPRMFDPRGMDPDEPNTGWWDLRYRKWYPMLPPECQKPLYITECGIDSGAHGEWDPGGEGGWRSFVTAEQYVGEDLPWYDSEIMKDPYVQAALIFCWGTLDPTWDSFCMNGRAIDLFQEYQVRMLRPTDEPDPAFQYHSHIVLVPQVLLATGWNAIRKYVDTWRVTVSRSEHDAVSMRGGLSHSVTAVLPTGARVAFLETEQGRSPFILDVIGGDWTTVRTELNQRAANGIRIP